MDPVPACAVREGACVVREVLQDKWATGYQRW